MKKIVLKLSAFALILSLLSAVLISCGGLERDEIVSIASELIEKSYEVNEIFYGEGLPLNEKSLEMVKENIESGVYNSVRFPPYVEVDISYGYGSIDDIKAASLEVYTEKYSAGMFETAFEGITDAAGNTVYFARYIENDYGALAMRYDEDGSAYKLSRTYDMDSLVVNKQRSSYVVFTVDSYVDGDLSEPVEIRMEKTPSGWRLDTPTY